MVRCLSSAVLMLLASPAIAQTSIPVPEPSDAALFVIAVVGLVIGRHASKRPPDRKG